MPSTDATAQTQDRHLNAVSRLSHAADLLWAFAQLRHVTVATPELLNCLGGEVHLTAHGGIAHDAENHIRMLESTWRQHDM